MSHARFLRLDDIAEVPIWSGLHCRPILGERMLVNVVRFEPNSHADVHVHDEEQIVLVLDGEMEFTLDGVTTLMRRGDVAVVPPNIAHGARTLDTDCLEVDIFAPPRTAILEMLGVDGA